MTSPKELRFLKPVAEDHSIQEVVFTLYISPSTPIENPASFKTLHSGSWKKRFPKFEIIRVREAGIHANWDTGKAEVKHLGPELDIGFSFESYFPDGKLDVRVRGENGDVPKPWISVNFLTYPGWDKIFPQAQKWLRKIARKAPNINVVAFGLHYIDHLVWESDKFPPVDKILNLKSNYLPGRIDASLEGWHSRMGYKFIEGENTRLDNVNIHIQNNPQNNFSRFVINMPLRVNLTSTPKFKKFMYDKSENGFTHLANRLHNDNKSNLRDILTPAVRQMIGLK